MSKSIISLLCCAVFIATSVNAQVGVTTPAMPSLHAAAPNQFESMAGRWQITYASGTVRVYTVNNLGYVTFMETNGKKFSGKLIPKGDVFMLELQPNKIERISLANNGDWKVEHFDPKGKLEAGQPGLAGNGVKLAK